MSNRAKLYIEQSQQYIKDGLSNDFIKMNIMNNDVKARLRMVNINGIYDSTPKLKFLEKAVAIDDNYNTCEKINHVQCFNIGLRKVIKVWIVASHNGYSLYKEKDLSKMVRTYNL